MALVRTPLRRVSGGGVSLAVSLFLQEQQGALDPPAVTRPPWLGLVAPCRNGKLTAAVRPLGWAQTPLGCPSVSLVARLGPLGRLGCHPETRNSHNRAVTFLCRPVGRAWFGRQEGGLRSTPVCLYFQPAPIYPHPAAPGKAHESQAEAGGASGPRSLWGPPWAPHLTPSLPRRPESRPAPPDYNRALPAGSLHLGCRGPGGGLRSSVRGTRSFLPCPCFPELQGDPNPPRSLASPAG